MFSLFCDNTIASDTLQPWKQLYQHNHREFKMGPTVGRGRGFINHYKHEKGSFSSGMNWTMRKDIK